MATLSETAAIDQIEAALANLRTRYAVAGGAENRRDQIGAFLKTTFDAIEVLADISGADALIIAGTAETVKQDLECAFFDVVEAEEEAEPRIDPVRQWGTYNTLNGA